MANPRVAWGIDIGNRALKAVKLVRTGTGIKIDDYDLIEHENLLSNAGDNRETLIQTALAVFQGKHNLKGLPAGVGVSGQQSFARFIKLPPVEEKQIPQIVKFEAIQQIPFPLDEVEWSYQLFRDEGNPDIEVGIFAMRRELVNQHLAYFTASGVNVQAVQMNPLAVYNALAYDDKIKGATMVIDLGAENADLIIAEGETVWMRSIPIGGNHFTEALVRDFKLRFERAEELKRTTATSPHGRRILQAMRPVFADLVSEIQRSIGFYSSTHRDSRIARVIALGGTFKLPGLQKYLQQNLGLEVHKLDNIGLEPPSDARIAAAISENALSSASAYGLALQALGEAKITSSLLPLAIQKERMWKEKTKYFAAAAAAVVVGAGVAFGTLQVEKSAYTNQQSARTEIDNVISNAKRLSDEWGSSIQGAGSDALKTVADVNTLSEHRDVWPTLLTEINSVIPQPVTRVTTKPVNGPTRENRTDIKLEDMEVVYVPSIDQLVAKNGDQFMMADSDFNTRVGQRDPASLVGVRTKRGNAAGMPGMPGMGIPMPGMQGIPMSDAGPVGMPGGMPMPSPTGNPGDPAMAGSHKHGFLITLHLTTTNKGGISFIDAAVKGKLLANDKAREMLVDQIRKQIADPARTGPAPKLPKFPWSIARASIPTGLQLKNDQVRQQAIITQALADIARKAAAQPNQLNVPGATGPGGQINLRMFTPDDSGGGMPMPGMTPGMPGMIPGMPGAMPGATGQPTPAMLAQYLVDPITKEDVRGDWDITVLLAIVIDPFSVQAPADGSAPPDGSVPPP